MRKPDKEITSRSQIESIIKKAPVCRIALMDDVYPYILPVNFVLHDNHLYFHTGREGKKIDLLKKNNQVCFEIESDVEIVEADKPCSWNTRYRSVIGYGRALFIENEAEKKQALDYLMKKYSGKKTFSYNLQALEEVLIIRIAIDQLTGKQSGWT